MSFSEDYFNEGYDKDLYGDVYNTPKRTAEDGLYPRRPMPYPPPRPQPPQHSEDYSSNQPVKEVRVIKRNGNEIAEEYERLNPDGTVTKTVTVGDKQDGLKHFGVYKMDKSGIVRRIDNPDPAELPKGSEDYNPYSWLDEMRRIAARQREMAKDEEYARYANKPNPNAGLTREDRLMADMEGGRVMEYKMEKEGQLARKLSQLTPDERTTLYNKYKQKVFDYGTKKLLKNLEKRLDDDKLKKIRLTDEEKQGILQYSVRKLHKLLDKSLNEDKFFNEMVMMDAYENGGDLKRPENTLHSTKQPNSSVSFNLQPSDLEEIRNTVNKRSIDSKPISFTIRPSNEAKISSEPSSEAKHSIFDRFKTFWKDNFNKEKENEEDSISRSEPKHVKRNDRSRISDEDFRSIEKSVKKHIKDADEYRNAPMEKQEKDKVVDYILHGMHNLLSNSKDKEKSRDTSTSSHRITQQIREDLKMKSKEEKTKKRNDDGCIEIDTEDVLSAGIKSLKKLLRRGEKIKFEKEDNKIDEAWWDLKSLLSQTKPEKMHHKIETHPRQLDKNSNSFFKQPFEQNVEKETLPPKCNEQNLRDKSSTYYHLRPQEKLRINTESQKNERKGMDFNSYFSSIREDDHEEVARAGRKAAESARASQRSERGNCFPGFQEDQNEKIARAARKSAEEHLATQNIGRRAMDFDNYLSEEQHERIARAARKNAEADKAAGASPKMEMKSNYFSGFHGVTEATKTAEASAAAQSTKSTRPEIHSNTDEKISSIDSLMAQIRKRMSDIGVSSAQSNLKDNSSSYQQASRPNTTKHDAQQNKQFDNSVSFHIKPQIYGNTNEDSYKTVEKVKANVEKSNTESGDFMPWWFDQSPEPKFVKVPLIKKPVSKDSFFGDSLFTDSAFSEPLLDKNMFPSTSTIKNLLT